MTMFNQWWQIYCSLRPVIWLWRLSLCCAAFVFVLKLKVNTEDDVLTTRCMPGRFAQENVTSGRHRCPISLSMLKVPNENVTIIVSLFSNPKNNSPQSAFYTASISNWIGLHQVLLVFLIMAQSIPSVPIPPSRAFVILSVPSVGNL